MFSGVGAVLLNAAQSIVSRTSSIDASIVTHHLHCTSSVCGGNGNHLRAIIVRYERGTQRWHTVSCPYCRREMHLQLNAVQIQFVAPEIFL